MSIDNTKGQGTITCLVTINKQGIIQSVDNNCGKMFGYELAELLGQAIKILIPSPYREQHDSYIENYHKTGRAKIIGRSRTVEAQHKDGTIFTVRLSVSEIGTLYIGLITKIEEMTTIITANSEGIIVNCTEHTEEIWGYKPDELYGKNLKILMKEKYQQNHDQYIKNYNETGQMKVIGKVRNVPALHKNGIVFPICLQVQRFRIDDKEFFRAKVERVEENLEVVFTLDEKGLILSSNKIFIVPIFGFSANEISGKPISFLIAELGERNHKRKCHSYEEVSSPSKKLRVNSNTSIPILHKIQSPLAHSEGTSSQSLYNSQNEQPQQPFEVPIAQTEENQPNFIEIFPNSNPASKKLEQPEKTSCLFQPSSQTDIIKEQNDSSYSNSCTSTSTENVSNTYKNSTENSSLDKIYDTTSSKVSISELEKWAAPTSLSVKISDCKHKDGSSFKAAVLISKFTNHQTVCYSCKIRRIASTPTLASGTSN